MKLIDKNILSLDVGEVRVGVAIASPVARLPRPLFALPNDDNFIEALKQIIASQNISQLVIGWPRNMQGEETAQTEYVRQFSDNLKKHINLPITFIDETLTSHNALERLKEEKGEDYTKADVDAMAAVLILEGFLNGNLANEEQ